MGRVVVRAVVVVVVIIVVVVNVIHIWFTFKAFIVTLTGSDEKHR